MIGWVTSPLAYWQQASILHKLAVGGAGAGLGYFLHRQQKYPWWQIAIFSVVAAYGTSVVLHASSRFPTPNFAQPSLPAPPASTQAPAEAASNAPVSDGPPAAAPMSDHAEPVSEEGGTDDGIFG